MELSFIQRVTLAAEIYKKCVGDDQFYLHALRLIRNLPTEVQMDEATLRKITIADIVLKISESYERARLDDRHEVLSIGDEIHVIGMLVDNLARLGVLLPGMDYFKPGHTEYTKLFDTHLSANGISIGVNRGNDQELKLYPKPEFDGLGEK